MTRPALILCLACMAATLPPMPTRPVLRVQSPKGAEFSLASGMSRRGPSLALALPVDTNSCLYYLACTATGTNGLESDYSAELVFTNYDSNWMDAVTCAWDAVSGAISNYTLYAGGACRTYTNRASSGTNLTAMIWINGPPLTNHVVTVTTINAINLQRSPSPIGPWTLVGATSWTATNPVAPLYFRAMGASSNISARAFITSTAF